MRAGAFAFTCLRLEPEHRVHPQPVPRELNRERWFDELGAAVWVHREMTRLLDRVALAEESSGFLEVVAISALAVGAAKVGHERQISRMGLVCPSCLGDQRRDIGLRGRCGRQQLSLGDGWFVGFGWRRQLESQDVKALHF